MGIVLNNLQNAFKYRVLNCSERKNIFDLKGKRVVPKGLVLMNTLIKEQNNMNKGELVLRPGDSARQAVLDGGLKANGRKSYKAIMV